MLPSLRPSPIPRISRWRVIDSGSLAGAENMRIDREALERALNGNDEEPTLRFFGWTEPTITYGYLLDPAAVESWAANYDSAPLVQRPTGGGAVFHTPADLSLSLLWPRESKLFSSHPRTCYAEIHEVILKTLADSFDGLRLHAAAAGCDDVNSPSRFSACFQAPVCNDVMLDDKKIAGGALRVTKAAMLYQGTIQLPESMPPAALRDSLAAAFN